VPDETLPLGPGDDATTSGAAESGMADDDNATVADNPGDGAAAEPDVAELPAGGGDGSDDDGGGLAWVVPLAIVLAAAGGAGFWLMKRRSAAA
jgi:hypothetical protein